MVRQLLLLPYHLLPRPLRPLDFTAAALPVLDIPEPATAGAARFTAILLDLPAAMRGMVNITIRIPAAVAVIFIQIPTILAKATWKATCTAILLPPMP